MLLIRRFEERAGQLYGMGLIGGFCHLYIGQEAVVVGMQTALQPGDQVITAYRDHGHMLACGMDPKGVMAELTGRTGGYSRGKGGSMHMFSVEKGFYGGHGIVGAQVSLGTGLAFANRYRGNDKVSLTYFGDGAANQGQVYESFNMAELWKLPVVYIIENNQYAMGTSIERSSATDALHKRGLFTTSRARKSTAWTSLAVQAAAEKAVERPRGQRPDDPGDEDLPLSRPLHVRPGQVPHREEVERVRTEHDPIDHVSRRIIERWATEDELKQIDAEIRAVVTEAPSSPPTTPSPIRQTDSTPTWLLMTGAVDARNHRGRRGADRRGCDLGVRGR